MACFFSIDWEMVLCSQIVSGFSFNRYHLCFLHTRWLHDSQWDYIGSHLAQGEVQEFRPNERKLGGLGRRLSAPDSADLPTPSLHFLQAKHMIPEETFIQTHPGCWEHSPDKKLFLWPSSPSSSLLSFFSSLSSSLPEREVCWELGSQLLTDTNLLQDQLCIFPRRIPVSVLNK